MGPTSTQKLIDTIRTEKNLKLMGPTPIQKLIDTIRIEKILKLMVLAPYRSQSAPSDLTKFLN